MKKKMISEHSKRGCILGELDGMLLDDVSEFAETIKKDLPATAENLRFDLDYWYDESSLYVVYDRLETDQEYQLRLEQEDQEKYRKKLQKKNKEEQERKEYERLKKKFG